MAGVGNRLSVWTQNRPVLRVDRAPTRHLADVEARLSPATDGAGVADWVNAHWPGTRPAILCGVVGLIRAAGSQEKQNRGEIAELGHTSMPKQTGGQWCVLSVAWNDEALPAAFLEFLTFCRQYL